MKEKAKDIMHSHILRDFMWYETQKIPWTDQLYELSKKKNIRFTPQHIETLVKVLWQVSQDETEAIRRKAVFALSNLCKNSEVFVGKCAEMGVFEILISSFLVYDPPAQMAICSIIASYCRQCKSEDVVYIVTKLDLLDFMLTCLSSMEEHLIIAVARALYEMVPHIKLLLDLTAMGLFEIMALIMMDDLQGRKESTLPVITVLRRASEHDQPVPHIIVRSGCMGLMGHFLHHSSIAFQKLSLCTIMNIGLKNLDYVTSLFGPDLFNDLISILILPDVEMKFCAANLIKKITETSQKLTNMLLENGLLEALLYSLQTVRYSADPSLISLATVLQGSLLMTKHFIELKGHLILAILLHEDCCEYVIFSIIQIFTDIYKRGKPFNSLIANLDIYPRLVELYRRPTSSRYLRTAMSDSCKQFLQDCTDWGLIKEFFLIAPPKQLAFVVKHFSEVLPTSLQDRKEFLEMDGLLKVCRMPLSPGDPVKNYVDVIKACFPPDAVNYYNPEFEKSIMQRVKNHNGIIHSLSKSPSGKWENRPNDKDEDEESRSYN